MFNSQLAVFTCVADCGSFNKAAEKLYLSPPSVMKQMSRDHPLARKERLTIEDLYSETLMMGKRGDSATVDRIRAEIQKHPQICIEDAPRFYDMEVFNRCAQTQNVMLTVECWKEVHPALVTIPVDWDYSIPYGLLFALEPTEDVRQFLKAAEPFIGRE